MGELSVASELATRSVLALETVEDDRLRVEIYNRLGIFWISFLDYDRAIEQFETFALGAAERIGDREKICRQLHNIADGLRLAARQRQLAHVQTGGDELARAETVVRELLARATEEFNRRTASHRLLAEALCELGRVEEALAVLSQFRDQTSDIAPAAQRAALAWIEARCLRLAGRPEKAVDRGRAGCRDRPIQRRRPRVDAGARGTRSLPGGGRRQQRCAGDRPRGQDEHVDNPPTGKSGNSCRRCGDGLTSSGTRQRSSPRRRKPAAELTRTR